MKGLSRDRLVKLFALMGSDNQHERESARAVLDEYLRKHRKTWNDLTELLQTGSADDDDGGDADDAASSSTVTGANISVLDLVHGILEEYLEVGPHEHVAIALWCLHTHVYDRFLVTPRLALTSPVRGCGKTIALDVLNLLTARGSRHDHISPASVYRIIDRERGSTLLLDEVDNLGLGHNFTLRAVLNSGHRRGGCITRTVKDAPRRFPTFAPMAFATIGALPLPLMHRSLVVPMARATRTNLRRFSGSEPAIDHAYGMARAWARDVQLPQDPELPAELRNRPADNWRVMVSVGDSFGPAWGARARDAAIHFLRTHRDEDMAVILLRDIRDIFDRLGVDYLHSEDLVAELIGMDDAPWASWRGLQDNQQPRHLSQGELARLLAPFGIQPKSIWPPQRKQGAKSRKGYRRSYFLAAWQSYCSEAGTPAQPRQTAKLRRV